jgi:site-specific recombinase XerD
VFRVPNQLVLILKRDLRAAGIDQTGADVHAPRHTTATYLARAGVAPRTAQAFMRHSDIRLTLGAYTDPRLMDLTQALDALPKAELTPAKQVGATVNRPA